MKTILIEGTPPGPGFGSGYGFAGFFLGCFLVLQVSFSWAGPDVTPVDLQKELHSLEALSVYDLVSLEGSVKKTSVPPITKVKVYQSQKQYEKCVHAAVEIGSKSEITEWLSLAAFQCAQAVSAEKEKIKLLKEVIKTWSPLAAKISDGENFFAPWRNAWAEAWSQAHRFLLSSSSKPQEREQWLKSWAHAWATMGKDNQAQWYEWMGDEAVKKKQIEKSLYFYRQSYELVPQKNLAERLLAFLPKTFKTLDRSQPVLTAREQDIENKVQTLTSQGAWLDVQETMIEALNEFPQGQYAKKYRDKVFDIYLSQSGDNKSAFLKPLTKADETRMVDWAQSLHRRGDYPGAQFLAEKAMSRFRSSPQKASLLWMAGRSAHFVGDYKKAQEYFEELGEKFTSAEEAQEAFFRLGLIHFRSAKYKLSADNFERVRAMGKDRYELNAWYWQIRALERQGDSDATQRAEKEKNALIERFPFSYYGLRLRAEKKNGELVFEGGSKRADKKMEKAEIFLLPFQKATWKRWKFLVRHGWLVEAQQELVGLPQPTSLAAQIKWIELMAKAQHTSVAILLLNRLMDTDENFKDPSYLGLVFPKSFAQWIEPEAKRYGLDPVLVRSLIRQESAFSLRAVSTSNALGLMQMIPPTAEEVSKRLKLRIQLPEDMYRPEINIPMGTFYIADMINQFSQNVPMALAAYNAGPHRLSQWLNLRPEISSLKDKSSSAPEDELWFDELPWTETSFYVKAILRNIICYRVIDKGPVILRPVIWSDLVIKKEVASGSGVVN